MRPHSAKTRPASAIERRQQVYVDIAPSSSHPFRADLIGGSSSGSSLKENTPLLVSRTNSDNSMTSLSSGLPRSPKRRLSDASQTMPGRDGRADSKKPKLTAAGSDKTKKRESSQKMKRQEPRTSKAAKQPLDGSSEFPNGAFYCHQCNKKRDISEGAHCTYKPAPSDKESRCKARYCRACLKNRYAQALDDIKGDGATTLTKKDKEKHVSGEGYYFQCPKCRDECNCRNCRKAKGLEPTGNLTFIARREGKSSAAACLKDDPAAMGVLPGKGQQLVPEKKPRGVKKVVASAASTLSTKEPTTRPHRPLPKPRAPKTKPAPPPKPVPKPLWIRVPTVLDRTDAEARIHIREFALRFSSLLDIAKGHLDELEEISGETVADEEEVELVGWVSEACVKALILGLLSMLADGCNSEGISKITKDTMKEIRASGANLNRIWAALASLRNGLRSVPSTPFNVPDPLPPPSTVTFRSTRSGVQGKSTDAGTNIAYSAQLVPVIAALVESAIQTRPVREEIEHGVIEEKELVKDVREAVLKENNRWKDRTASGTQAKGNLKAERAGHKQTLQDLEHAHSVAQTACIPRYNILGQDHEGRVYYALTPGEAEREAAIRLIAGKDGKVKLHRKRGGLTEEDRRDMNRWSWFVAVWGKLPDGAVKVESEDESEDEDEDEDEDRDVWWGFWDPQEITKVADWIDFKCELGDAKSKSSARSVAGSAIDKGKAVEARASTYDTLVTGSSLAGSREPSPLSDLPSDEDSEMGDDSNEEDAEDLYAGMRTDPQGRPVSNRRELRELVKNLKGYADLLQWRVHRVGGDAPVAEK